jgi:hypothetical protein
MPAAVEAIVVRRIVVMVGIMVIRAIQAPWISGAHPSLAVIKPQAA